MRKQTRRPDEIEFISAVIRISEDANVLREERITYSVNNLFSDVGGDLGLFLGLCVWSMVHSAMQAVVVIRNKAENFKYRRIFKKSRFWTKKKFGISRRHLSTPSERINISRDRSQKSSFSKPRLPIETSGNEKNDEIQYILSLWLANLNFYRI